ncbi:glutathione S-transferase [Novosphingobium marinum]|uniref:Glutathione S-transferase n=1 Tax=Novosphingobium marinum TaxID=1514948 RepID=A0A7Y9XY47_9SPHN|nr:glutathione S-transferase family protein [Novosphingobium marinum]NYH96747.1 glutathione S-transferase [Novosphingobium marinum]GGC40533.1 glutathione S-transferase [Novosphingobium marinum]
MIFYDFDVFAPSPWIAWMFIREKGLEPERREIALLSRDNRREDFVRNVNPLGELPAIVLEDGTAICEIVAICEYIEDTHPEPPLIGATPLERAETRMWVRRIDQNIAMPMGEGFIAEDGAEFFEADRKAGDLLTKIVLPREAGPVLKHKANEKMLWIDGMLKDREWVCGDRFSLADIYLHCFLQFGENHGQPIPAGAPWLQDFFRRMKSRPTAWHGEPGSLE